MELMMGKRYKILHGDVLIGGTIVLASCKAKACPDNIAGIELRLIAQERSNIRVFILATKLLQYNGRLLRGAILRVDGYRVSLADYIEKRLHHEVRDW